MQIIPVIDLMHGQVVHARKGEREHYHPIQSRLSSDSQPINIVNGLRGLYPFTSLYIADLDAIQKRGQHLSVVAELQLAHPELEIWIDAGFSTVAELQPWLDLRVRPVLGSESIADMEAYLAMAQACTQQHILSLDFTQQGYQGPLPLLNTAQYWPQDVIVMSLPHVGSNLGPDLSKLQSMQQQYSAQAFYAAGGTRDVADIEVLAQLGIKGVLIASALHDGRLDAQALSNIGQG